MASYRQAFNFFFVVVATIMLIATVVFNFGNTNALLATLPTQFVSQIQSQILAKQTERQVHNIAEDVNDPRQIKDIAEAATKKLENQSQTAVDPITDNHKTQKTAKMKRSGGLKDNVGWLTF